MREWRYRGGEQTWKDQGSCAGSLRAGAALFSTDRSIQVQAAREWCSPCPVRQECLDYAVANREEFGVWGGVVESRRRNRRWRDQMRSLAS